MASIPSLIPMRRKRYGIISSAGIPSATRFDRSLLRTSPGLSPSSMPWALRIRSMIGSKGRSRPYETDRALRKVTVPGGNI